MNLDELKKANSQKKPSKIIGGIFALAGLPFIYQFSSSEPKYQSISSPDDAASSRQTLMDQCLGLKPGTWNISMAESNGVRPGMPGEARCEQIVGQQLMDRFCNQHQELKCH